MVKYIKFDEAKKTLRDFIYECNASGMNPDLIRGITYTMEWLDRIPLEDVAPVVHGRRLKQNNYNCCSVCKQSVARYCVRWYKYCPNCGAKMIGDENNG